MKALYTTIKHLSPHPNADRLQVATIEGLPVIVGLNTKVGDTGLFISEGSQVSESFALEFKLLVKHPKTGEKLDGYLKPNCKISALTLRGQASMGVFVPCTLPMQVEQETDTINDELFVWKFETPAQLRVRGGGRAKRVQPQLLGFPCHHDTEGLNRNAPMLVHAHRIIVTEKLHGTSGRTGWARRERPLSKWQALWNRCVPSFLAVSPTVDNIIVTGSRSLHFADEPTSDRYREIIHRAITWLLEHAQHGREAWYYEIVGYTDRGKLLMPSHGKVRFTYGCKPPPTKADIEKIATRSLFSVDELQSTADEMLLGESFRVYVYRIVRDDVELTYDQIKARVLRAHQDVPRSREWLAPVPLLDDVVADTLGSDDLFDGSTTGFTVQRIHELGAEHCIGKSVLDKTHMREGAVLRGESFDGRVVTRAFKRKSHAFLAGEGEVAEDPESIDPEAVA
jgi:hypothetical protein